MSSIIPAYAVKPGCRVKPLLARLAFVSHSDDPDASWLTV